MAAAAAAQDSAVVLLHHTTAAVERCWLARTTRGLWHMKYYGRQELKERQKKNKNNDDDIILFPQQCWWCFVAALNCYCFEMPHFFHLLACTILDKDLATHYC